MYVQITDNGNLTVNVLAGNVLNPSFLYLFTVSHLGQNYPITNAATISGNGNTTLTLSKGLYFGWLEDQTTFAVSNSVGFNCTTADDSIPTRVRQAVSDTINALSLQDETGAQLSCYQQWTQDDTELIFPCVSLTLENVVEQDNPALSTVDDIGYPIRIMILDRVQRFEHTRMPDYDGWRYRIGKAFRRQRLTGVPESKINEVSLDPISNPELPKYALMCSELVIMCTCRQARGMGP